MPGTVPISVPTEGKRLRAENIRASRLVVIFKEARKMALQFDGSRQPVAHLVDPDIAHCVVEILVVNEREAQIEQALPRSPVGFGQQNQAGHGGVHVGPELRRRRRGIRQEAAPDPAENVPQVQHGHVAANAVAMAGDGAEIGHLRGPHLRAEMIELRHVLPRREIRVLRERDERMSL